MHYIIVTFLNSGVGGGLASCTDKGGVRPSEACGRQERGISPPAEGRQTETTLSATKDESVLSHTPSLLGGWRMQDVAALYQRTLPDVAVGTQKETSSAWTPVPDTTSP